MKYSLKKYLLNEVKDLGTVDAESKTKVERVLQKCLGWLLNELDGEWQVSKPIIYEDSQDSYIMKVELTNGFEDAEMRMGWKAHLNGDWSARKQIYESDVCPYVWLRVGDVMYGDKWLASDTLTATTRFVMKKCLDALSFNNAKLLKSTSQHQKKIPTIQQVAKIKKLIKEWCNQNVSGTNYQWIKLNPSGLQGSVRTNIDQSDFYDEDGEELGGKLDDQEYSFKVSLERKFKNWNMLNFIKAIELEYAGNEKGWLWLSVELNS